MRNLLFLCIAILLLLSSGVSHDDNVIDWSQYDLPDLGKDKMWCMFTSYVPINEEEQIYMCSYECENGMRLNTPGKGGCPRDVKERRW
jgi:hypothetical protein